MIDCVFCDIVNGKAPATMADEITHSIAIVPLNPVTPGHILVIPRHHVRDALESPYVTSASMDWACRIAKGPCNIITSVGREATQSVFHLHIHIVPRGLGDGLKLPWDA